MDKTTAGIQLYICLHSVFIRVVYSLDIYGSNDDNDDDNDDNNDDDNNVNVIDGHSLLPATLWSINVDHWIVGAAVELKYRLEFFFKQLFQFRPFGREMWSFLGFEASIDLMLLSY